MYIDVCEYKGEIHAWERDEEGTLSHIKAPATDYLYLFVRDNTGRGQYNDIYGNSHKEVRFTDKKKMADYADLKGDTCEADIKPDYRFLLDNYPMINATTSVNIGYFDIEVDFDLSEGTGYPTPTNPFGEINSISIFDTYRQQYAMFIPDEFQDKIQLHDEEFPVEIHWCNSEREILLAFSNYIEPIDILSAWFGDGFDIPYIMARAKLLFGERQALTLFSRNGVPASSREYVNAYGEDAIKWSLHGRIHLDLQELYKKFNPGEKPSFKLDAICEEELGMNKVEFEDDLGTLYRENPQKFFDYSLHDARLLYLLDRKLQMIALATMMAREMRAKLSDVTGSVKIIEQGFTMFCRQNGNVVLPSKKKTEKEPFPGAIVYDTIAGLHKWLFTIDLTALYPSVMIMLGLSTENYIMQCMNRYEDYISVMTKKPVPIQVKLVGTGEEVSILASELEEIIRESGYTISANGSVFDGSFGLLAMFVKFVFMTRKQFQAKKKEAATPEEANKYDMYQKVYKITANSLYGCITNENFRLYDIELGRSITMSAQVISKIQANVANELVNQLAEAA